MAFWLDRGIEKREGLMPLSNSPHRKGASKRGAATLLMSPPFEQKNFRLVQGIPVREGDKGGECDKHSKGASKRVENPLLFFPLSNR